ncbi:hypothetical protein N7454_007616 [Penicillium verhagenii]|nr:hypothetical protein N7454_007616 [Penicillium verhagenii]
MRTSRASKDTSRVMQALSSPARRQTRSKTSLNASALRSFTYKADSSIQSELIPTIASIPRAEEDDADHDDESPLSSANTTDIEDLLSPPTKRRRPNTNTTPLSVSRRIPNRQAQQVIVKDEPEERKLPPHPTTPPPTTRRSLARSTRNADYIVDPPSIKAEDAIVKHEPDEKKIPPQLRTRRMPARKTRDAEGSIVVEPPSNWEVMYDTIKKMRADNPTAPVDTMGCAELHWRASSPRDRRFQTLIALMLSSQTKDTVTAVAMQRLHTELGDFKEEPVDVVKVEANEIQIKAEDDDRNMAQLVEADSTLNLESILAVSPEKLNELIHTIGFHNNKTKYIKAAALILRDQHNGDIPSTPEGLMALPGVGPKMAYLCMSAAWGKHLGIGVDVHVHRITNLWGWHQTKNPEETRMALQSWLPRDKWHEINKLLVGLGQTVCLPVKRRCGECYLAGTKLCKSEVKGPGAPLRRDPKLEEPKIKIETVVEAVATPDGPRIKTEAVAKADPTLDEQKIKLESI